ncbi:hypothetical protein SASPL_117031 [Salvia splendens]|uniref:F-box domain-containing protein n=1 Tax=Salvia splendens TaxID=180675 RepID=A0A8X8XYH8_SALSN|nr:hypothetical protein SASPL_117031 [Salvia splendens]
MPNLPFELIEDILRRLPVKSLKRFRAVAKTWCCLIDSENFINLHLRQPLISTSHRNLIIGGLGVYSVDLEALDKAHVIKPPFYYKSVDGISNSCNGIVLVMSDPLVLWNTFSREYVTLPNCSTEMQAPFESYSKVAYGFGYDSESDDYKVVRVAEFRHKITHIWMASETKIYSLRSKSWRRIGDFPYALPFLRGNWRVHLNGVMHTLVEDPEEFEAAAVIMAFNLRTEKHTPIMLPSEIRIRGVDVSLDVLDGCLCVVCTSRHRVVIWVMKEYGVRKSWMKLLTISPPLIERNDIVKPLTYSRDGTKVLLNCDDKRLLWYDLANHTAEEVVVEGLPFVFYAEVCVESLVKLDNSLVYQLLTDVLVARSWQLGDEELAGKSSLNSSVNLLCLPQRLLFWSPFAVGTVGNSSCKENWNLVIMLRSVQEKGLNDQELDDASSPSTRLCLMAAVAEATAVSMALAVMAEAMEAAAVVVMEKAVAVDMAYREGDGGYGSGNRGGYGGDCSNSEGDFRSKKRRRR